MICTLEAFEGPSKHSHVSPKFAPYNARFCTLKAVKGFLSSWYPAYENEGKGGKRALTELKLKIFVSPSRLNQTVTASHIYLKIFVSF